MKTATYLQGYDFRTAGDWNPETQSEENVTTFETMPDYIMWGGPKAGFSAAWELAAGYRKVLSFDIPEEGDVETAYAMTQNGFEGSVTDGLKVRSAVIGDVYVIDGDAFAIMPCGWSKLTAADLGNILARLETK